MSQRVCACFCRSVCLFSLRSQHDGSAQPLRLFLSLVDATSPVQPPTVNLACTSLFGQPRPCLFFSLAHFSSRDTTRGHVLQAFHRHVWPHVRPSWSEPPESCVTYLGGTQPSSCVETHEGLTWTKKGRLPLFTLTNRDRASQRPFLHAGGGPSTWAVSTRKYPTVEAIVYAHISDLP